METTGFNENANLSFTRMHLKNEPSINVIEKEDFDDRVAKVFNILWEKLSRSFGPYGAGTFISRYPHIQNTKDGFTIMKALCFQEKLDQIITDMAASICGRLNYSVGDGTTTAIIATKTIYDGYVKYENYFKENNIMPRDIMEKFNHIKNLLLDAIDKASRPIRSDDPKVLRKNIYDVVYISSNGNEEISNIIADLYEQLMYPAFNCILATDGVTKSYITEGYGIELVLADKLYINSDDETMKLGASDVIVFDHKVTIDTYQTILKPLNNECKSRGRHLIVIAPYYDEVALTGAIRNDLYGEYKATKNINMVLTTCKYTNEHYRQGLHDLAMLLNTPVITKGTESEIMDALSDNAILNLFDLDNRYIDGAAIAVYSDKADPQSHTLRLVTYSDNISKDEIFNILNDTNYRVGYCESCSLGLKESVFSGFHYDPNEYDIYVSTAKTDLIDTERKYQNLGTFNLEVSQKQKRLYALGLKMGTIEVGGTSEIAQSYLKDMVDDATLAASSAYNNGVVLGCNVTTMRCIDTIKTMRKDYNLDDTDIVLLDILFEGFRSVYGTVLKNAFPDKPIDMNEQPIDVDTWDYCIENMVDYLKETLHINDDKLTITYTDEVESLMFDDARERIHSIFNIIEEYSIINRNVFDISSKDFNTRVINSAETDKEILKACIDLTSLLITGNQLVLC